MSITTAPTRQYHLSQEWVKIWTNQDGSIDMFYNISITLDSGDNINFIKVAQPQGDFTIGNATDQYGDFLSTSDASSGSDYKVQINLDSPLTAEQTIWFTVTTNVAKMIYEDNETNVGMQFTPTWWAEATVSDLRVSIVLPAGVAQSQIATSVNWDSVLLADGRLAIFWERTDLAPNQQYDFGVSFPKEYVQVYVGSGRVHNLDTGLNYTTIQEAIFANETLDGHVIHVDAGTYNVDYGVWINKSISLVGDGRENTTITGTALAPIFYVTADHVTISGFTMRNGAYGVEASTNYPTKGTDYVHIFNCNISDNQQGISMYYPYYPGPQLVGEIIEGNILMNNSGLAIYLQTNNSIIRRNLISGNGGGISLAPGNGPEELATGNLVYENTIENNGQGKRPGLIIGGYNNTIFLNNFLNNYNFQNNAMQAESPMGTNVWNKPWQDDDLIWGGNFWSDYNGTSHLGVGTTPYVIDENNTDNYPWAGMFNFYTFYDYEITIISNSSISDLEFKLINQTDASLTFKAAGQSGTEGFIRICIPNALIEDNTWSIKLDGELCPITFYVSNLTAWNTWVEYSQSVHLFEITGITAVPELPSFLILPLFMIATLLAIIVYKKRHLA